VTFDVLLAGAENVASYNIEVVLEAPGAAVGTDACFAAPAAAAAHYVFGADTAMCASAVRTVGARHYLTLSDWHDPDGDGVLDGINTSSDVNDRVARVTLLTSPSLSDSLFVSLNAASLELDTPLVDGQGAPVPISGFLALQNGLAAASPREVAVPEPSSLALLSAAAGAALLRRRRDRAAARRQST
jgi:hypothetical protein